MIFAGPEEDFIGLLYSYLLDFVKLQERGDREKGSFYVCFFFRAVLEGLKPTICLKTREK